jgi:hypothetical protein
MVAPVQTTFYNKTTQAVSVTASSAAISNAVGSNIHSARIACTVACYYKVGESPTATTSDAYLPANWVEYIKIHPGQKVAFIRASADGTATVTELTS